MLGTPPGETDSLTQARGSGVRIGEVNQERADTVAQIFLTVMHVVCKRFQEGDGERLQASKLKREMKQPKSTNIGRKKTYKRIYKDTVFSVAEKEEEKSTP